MQLSLDVTQVLDEVFLALATGDLAGAKQRLTTIASAAEDLRPSWIEAYQDAPDDHAVERYLGLLCLAAGRAEEGLFHLRRSTPNQTKPFTIDRCDEALTFRFEDKDHLTALISAYSMTGQSERARGIMRAMKACLRQIQTENVCQTLHNHVLWTRPDVLADVRGVVQVGANVGDEIDAFAKLAIPNVLAFEPVPSAFATLEVTMNRLAPPNRSWRPILMALLDKDGSIPFWEGQETGNSSFLELHPERSQCHLKNEHKRQIDVATTTLDAFFASGQANLGDYNLLFMDTQGTEHLVLEGARESLRSIDFVCLEVSFTEIYAGSLLADQMEHCLQGFGFEKLAEAPGSFPEQADVLYVRRDLIS